jgi:hypothetical protein
MAQPLTDLELQQLVAVTHDNADLSRFFGTLDVIGTLCRAVGPLAAEVRRLRQQTLFDEQDRARLGEQLRAQDADLTALRAQVDALKNRLTAPTAA